MAGNPQKAGRPLRPRDLAALAALTRELAGAVAQGDLDRALGLLEERRRVLTGLAWPGEAGEPLREEVRGLQVLEGELLEFCRRWRDIVRERLTVLTTSHRLLKKYNLSSPPPQFVDLQK